MSDLSSLLVDLARLPRVSPAVLAEIELMAPQMLAHLDVMLTHHPEMSDLPLPCGPFAFRRTLRRVAEGFIATLREGSALRLVSWCGRTLAGQRLAGFSPEHWRIEIECSILLLDLHLSPEAGAAFRPLLVWLEKHMDVLESVADDEAA